MTTTTPPIAEPAPAYTPVHHPQLNLELSLLPRYSIITPPALTHQQPPAPKNLESRPARKKRSPTNSNSCACVYILLVTAVSIICVTLFIWAVAKSTKNAAAREAETKALEKEKKERVDQAVLDIARWTEVNGVVPGEGDGGVPGVRKKLGEGVIGF